MHFDDLNLNSSLLKALDDMGFETPTTIQQKVFSVAMSGRDVCGIAQTGTGKTFAYLLPILRQWTFSKDRFPQVLVVVPTRELVVQVTDAVKQLAKYTNLVATGVFGGVNMKPQADAIVNGTDIVVGTPGRMMDLIYNGFLKTKAVKKLVIDEMDEMLNLGFRVQLDNLFDLLPAKRQNLLFSATITDDVEALMDTYFNSPVRIEAAPVGTPLENIEQRAYHVPNFNTKVNLLQLLLEEHEEMDKVLVFVSTKGFADELFERMSAVFPEKAGVIHSNKEQNYRFNVVKQFQEGNFRFIIATDIVARGIDIAGVSHVVNFDIPDVPENYIHRIGRTGRADEKGIAISFVTEKEQADLEKIETLMNYTLPVMPLPGNLELSDVLIEEEIPKVQMKTFLTKPLSREGAGAAFHEKSAKNKKVNIKVSHKDKMHEKYGKPKKRGKKK